MYSASLVGGLGTDVVPFVAVRYWSQIRLVLPFSQMDIEAESDIKFTYGSGVREIDRRRN